MNKFEQAMQTIKEEQAVPECVDRIFEETLESLPEKKRTGMKTNWFQYAAAAILLTGTVLCTTNPALAAKLPLVGNIFQMVQKEVPFSGEYSEVAESLTAFDTETSQNWAEQKDYSVTVEGVTFTASEVYCDGMSVFLTAEVTNENGGFAKIPGKSMYLRGAWSYQGETYNFGLEYLQGMVVDDETFVGMLKINLPEYVTEQETITLSLTSIGWDDVDIKDNDAEAHRVKGDWSFEIPFQVDTESVRKLAAEKEENGYTLKQIILSKYQATVQVEARDKACYVGLFTQNGEPLAFEEGKLDEETDINTFFFAVQEKEIEKIYVLVWDDFDAWTSACKQGMEQAFTESALLRAELSAD